jgi:UDP-N-acetylglucosamine transferase subunit ALG13
MAEFERLVAEAELLILHAGAGSVMHALQAGKVPIVMPRRVAFKECVDDHQVEFAEALSQAGRVVVVHDTEQMCAAIDRALALQGRLGNAGTRVPALVRLLEERLNHYSEVLRR